MTCATVTDDLVALLDGQLEPARADEVRAHLAACPACEAERQALAAVWERLDLLPGLAVRPGFLEEVEARLRAADGFKVHAGGRRAVQRWLAAAAAALLVAGAGLIVTTRPSAPWGAPKGDQALRPNRPAPATPPRTPQPLVTPPLVPPTPEAPPTRQPPTQQPPVQQQTPPTPAPARSDPLAGLPADERALIEHLELLRDLRELEQLGLLDAADLFDDLEAEEFDG
ncbi:MAG: zf-HC2 domain-containing protein [Planctomycetes bacterium]|nr:zf-HC2 domain-containing protein [Planctomycetota bacterium]